MKLSFICCPQPCALVSSSSKNFLYCGVETRTALQRPRLYRPKALPLLQDFAETLGERLRRFPDDLPGEDISDGIHHDFGLLVAVVAYQLGEILKSQKHGHLVASRRRNQVVQALEIDGRQLVDDNRGFEFPLFTENSLCRGSL